MVNSVGIDIVEIKRFAHWSTYPPSVLKRIFSACEIAYCLSNEKRSAERFAVRFAAREAVFKALSSAHTTPIIFLTLCKAMYITHSPTGSPHVIVDWKSLNIPSGTVHCSLSHTQTVAAAFIVLSTEREK